MTARRWITVLAVALLLSLGLNLFLGGAMAGRMFGQRSGGGGALEMTPANLKIGIERVLRVLPVADATIMRGMFEAQRGDLRQRFVALQRARKAVGEALRAESFDPAAFAAAYETMQARSQEVQAAVHGVIKAAVPQLSAEGRLAIAERRWRK